VSHAASAADASRLLSDPRPARVAVLRALHLGDMLCAVPALRALRRALPDASIALIGLPWAATFAARFAAYIDDFLEFPGFPGLPERDVDPARLARFLDNVRRNPLDLAIQLHGSGSHVNECIALLKARRSAGFFQPGDLVPDSDGFIHWPTHGTETRRLLALMRALGAPADDESLEFPLDERDYEELDGALASSGMAKGRSHARYVCVHPGARFRSRRWPAARFARVADGLAVRGFDICITGTTSERAVTAEVRDAMRCPATDLTGRLTLGAFAALVRGASLAVANDTGISHIAAAVGTPSVIVASGSDVERWAPHDGQRHRVLWQAMACRPCMYEVCPIGHPCAEGIGVDAVLAAAVRQLARAATRDEVVTAGAPS
jgi:ADP-heptose:LPS heptosyltransferase